MAYLNIKIPADGAQSFNWDEIDVGNHHLDHSQKFFAQKHLEHERQKDVEEMELVNKRMQSARLDKPIMTEDSSVNNKENLLNSIPEVKVETSPEDVLRPTQNNPLTNSNNNNVAVSSDVPNQKGQTSNLDVTVKPLKQPANLASQWSTQKPVIPKVLSSSSGAIARPVPPPPHAYIIKDLYKRNREEALRRRHEEERKMREFHSRPVPNYNHEQLEKRKFVHAVTVPVTPLVLKKSREMEEKRKKKMEEWKQKNQPPKFESRSPNVLKADAFVPKKVPVVVEPRPFNLRTEKRLVVRKQFDAAMLRAREEKEKQEEEERRKREEERAKELRKNTAFKARPNPFK